MVRRRGRRPLSIVAFALLALLGACGESDDGAGSSSSKASAADVTVTAGEALSKLEAEVASELQFPRVGVTQAEVECLAVILAAGAGSAQEALDKTAPYDSLTGALEDLAPDCFTAERRVEIQAAFEEYEEQMHAETEASIARMMADTLLGGGSHPG